MVWMQPVHFSFLDGLDATSPFFFSRWSGCNQSIFLFLMVWMQPVHFSFLNGLDATSPFFFSRWSGCHFSFLDCLDATSPFLFSQWSGCNQSIFLFLMVWIPPVHFLFRLDVCCRVKPSKALRKIFSLHGHTTLHYDCPIIIADFFETQDNWNVLPLAAYPQHHDIHHCMYSSSRISNATNHVWGTRCLLRSSGGGCAAKVGGRTAAQHATIFSMPRRVAAQ